MESVENTPPSEEHSPKPAGAWGDFFHRFLSSLAIVAVILGALLWNTGIFSLVFMLAGLWILVEWFEITRINPYKLLLALSVLGLGLGSILGAFYGHWFFATNVLSATLAGLLFFAETKRDKLLGALGFLCASIIALALVYLRQIPIIGLTVVCWVFVIVATVDTLAFFTGRLLGGPKILPSVSPNKTWAGMLGGTLSATLAGTLSIFFAKTAGVPISLGYSMVALLSFIGAIVAQIGDFLESYLKRIMGVKNSGTLIPGHGGLMDRLDSLCMLSFCTLVVFALQGSAS